MEYIKKWLYSNIENTHNNNTFHVSETIHIYILWTAFNMSVYLPA